MIKGIFAMDTSRGIGKNGTLPWPKNKEDLSWFKHNTDGAIVVMGSSTWLDDKFPKPLSNRYNIVLTSQNEELFKEAHQVINFKGDDLIRFIKEVDKQSEEDVWVIGGISVFEQLHDLIEEYYITVINGDYKCDRIFELSLYDFKQTYSNLVTETQNQYTILKRFK